VLSDGRGTAGCADAPEERCIVDFIHWLLAGHPLEQSGVGHGEKRLELGQFLLVKSTDLGIRELAENEIHFSHASPPRAHQGAAPARVEICA